MDAHAYRENLFRLLGDRDPLEVLAQTAPALGEIVRTHSAKVLRSRPFEGKWTPNEIIGHLVDGEWTYGYRLASDSFRRRSRRFSGHSRTRG